MQDFIEQERRKRLQRMQATQVNWVAVFSLGMALIASCSLWWGLYCLLRNAGR